MNAPLIWIIVPLLAALLLFFLRNYRLTTLITGMFVSLILALLAASVPIGEAFNIGSLELEISSTLTVLGRRFILTNNERTFLVLLFSLAAAWFLGAGITWAHRFFAPFGMGMIAMLVAALAVEPFLYAALLVEVAVLFCIPILAPPGMAVKSGVQRFLLFQTLAMPFILFAGWLLGLGEANPNNPEILIRAGLLLGLGFAFWLAVFPFYSWVPQLAHETHPYPAGFVLSLLPMSALLLGLDFLNGFTWLRTSVELYQILQFVGILMVVTGGIWAMFQNDLSRMLGYAVIVETGFALIALSLRSTPGFTLFAISFLPRLLGLIVLALALGVLVNQGKSTRLDGISGLFGRFPYASVAVLSALFSMGGFPLLAGFPVRLEIMEQLAGISITSTSWVLLGSAGFLVAGLRVLSWMVRGTNSEPRVEETWPQRFLLLAGVLFLLLFGLLPGVFYDSIVSLLRVAPAVFLVN